MTRIKTCRQFLFQSSCLVLLFSELLCLPNPDKRVNISQIAEVSILEKPLARSADPDVKGQEPLVLFIDVEKKLEKHKELLDKEMNKSNQELKKILKHLGANYKKSVELAQSLLSNIVDVWSRIEDTSKDADPISDEPDSYNLADLLLLANDSGLCHEAHFLPAPEDENKIKLIAGSEANETDPPSEEDPELESIRTISNLTLDPPRRSETKEDLIKRLKSLGDDLESIETELSPRLLIDFKDAWLRIVNKSNEFFDVRVPQSKQEEEDLRIYTARILFLSNERPCESPDETFFKGQCISVGPTEHCPENMELNDGPKNQGFCDCLPLESVKEKSDLRIIYSVQKKKCYTQNTQGPCPNGQWFVLRNNVPQCEENSGGCPADGRHVYWSPDAGVHVAKKCWEIGTKGPCDPDERLHLRQDTGDVEIYCDRNLISSLLSPVIIPPVPSYRAACQVGSYRKQRLKCERPFL